MEVDLAEAGQLAVGVHAAATDGARQVVDVAGEQALAVAVVAAKGSRLEKRVGSEEVAVHELQLVVRVVALGRVRRLELDEVVAALLENDAVPPGGGDRLGERRPAGPGADDDDASVVGHRRAPDS